MANEEDEVVPDSWSTSVDSILPILSNPTNSFATESMTHQMTAVLFSSDDPSPTDSQETHLSENSTENISMDIPVVSAAKLPSTLIKSLGNETVEWSIPESINAIEVSYGDETTMQPAPGEVPVTTALEQEQAVKERARINLKLGESDQVALSKVPAEKEVIEICTNQADSDMTQMDSSETAEISCVGHRIMEMEAPIPSVKKCEETMNELENVEKSILELSNAIVGKKSQLSESSITNKESKIHRKLADIVSINKKEKDRLMTLKKNGEKVSKESLIGLANCHRKLVATVQQQKILSKKIKIFQKQCQMEEEDAYESTQGVECSQSLLRNSMLPDEHGCFSQPKCLPPSILKNATNTCNGDENTEASLAQKKMVKFQIPYKGKGTTELHASNGQVLSIASKQGHTILKNGNEMCCGNSTDKNIPVVSERGRVFNTSHEVRRNDSIWRNTAEVVADEVFAPAATSGETLACDHEPPQQRSNFFGFPHTEESMDCDNESIGCSSLISGLSDVDIPLSTRCSRLVQQSQTSTTRPRTASALFLQQTACQPRTIVSSSPSVQNVTSFQLTQPIQYSTSTPVIRNTDVLLDLFDLIKRGLIVPGSGVVRCLHEGKSFSASLLQTGSIQSTGGEVFRSPMIWLKAVMQLKHAPSRMRSYKLITWNGKFLSEICAAARSLQPQSSFTTLANMNPSVSTVFVRHIAPPCSLKEMRPVVDLTENFRQAGNDCFSRPESQKLRLVQDEELFSLSRAFPGFDWDDVGSTPKNIEDYFL